MLLSKRIHKFLAPIRRELLGLHGQHTAAKASLDVTSVNQVNLCFQKLIITVVKYTSSLLLVFYRIISFFFFIGETCF